ncbi:MAG: TrkH family potassium uptake protein [Actinomycetota bacterium]|nr:TrkH family potassium uptake protein [Actinomycetota bacterium]
MVVAFAAAVALGALLLALPVARSGGGSAPLLVALFTATSAVCVTGLVVVDTPSYWSAFGEFVILLLIQVGGFGIMTLASLLALLVSRRLGLSTRLTAQAETRTLGLGDVRQVLRGVALASILFEGTGALLLFLRLWTSYEESVGQAAYHGVFHSVSAFNNAGFALYSANLIAFVGDPVVCLTIAVSVIAGGLGFPVLFELRRAPTKPRLWSLHTKITVGATFVLLVGGTLMITAIEWGNPATLGSLSVPGKLLAGFFQGTMPRTAGYNSVDYAQMDDATWLVTDVLMFIGGAPASTAGGIKVTTFALLGFVILAEARGAQAVNVAGRRLPANLQREAVSVALLGVAGVVVPSFVLLLVTDFALDRVLFEAASAFGTVGLSTGITADLPPAGQLVLVAVMFMGRLGPVTLAAALALRRRPVLYRLPEERPIVG